MFLDHPFIGVGWGNFSTSFLSYRPELIQNSRYAHNLLVQVLAETGIIGFSAFAFLSYTFFTCPALADKGLTTAVRLALAGFLIVNTVDYSFYIMAPQMLFLFCAGILFSARPAARAKPGAYSWGITLACSCLLVPIVTAVTGIRLTEQSAAAFRSGNTATAVALLQRAVTIDPLPVAPYEKLAELSFETFNRSADRKALNDAIGYQKVAIKRNNASAAAWSDLAWLYWVSEAQEDARNAIARAVVLDRHNMRYKTTLRYFTDHYATGKHEKK
jgi:tetratricopeptide (TPR) repeat protein